jgi:uncharacterized membrane-anchored protein YhcB (DUF1043 family)
VEAVTVGTVIGALIGVVSLLLKLLVNSKNKQIEQMDAELKRVIAERDLFRDLILTARRER